MMGSTALTAPLWLTYLGPFLQTIDPLVQFLAAALGLLILVLTAWNKALEVKLKRSRLNEIEEAEDGNQAKK
ncbi:hypothetical protein GFB49_11675 [Epibacterium sp. SM1979]|uniref:Holin n=2 Tax=Tritonibacter litoralis TaxID=2662264 RepID=A0A843YDJ0_9RHOB|nr:hypothetical protein [Tritonibacter litoralis]